MINRKISKYIILLLGLLFFTTGEGMGQKKSEQLKKDKNKIENEIKQTQNLLNQTQKNKNASLQQLSVLRKQISNREALITAMNNEIFALEEELDLNQKLLVNLDKKLEYMKEDYARVVYLAYKNRKTLDIFTFLLSSENFAQMFRRARYYKLFSSNVKNQVELIHQTQEDIAEKNEEILKLKEEKVLLLDGKEREIKELEKDRKNKSKVTEDLKKQERQLSAELKKKQAKRKELDLAIKKAIEEEIKAENERKAKSAKSNVATSSGKTSSKTELLLTPEELLISNSFGNNKGKLPWPVVKGAKISDFGVYPHPDVPTVMIENRGIDILVEDGAQVRSVFEGVVAGVMDIMGTKVVMVRHGDYLTVYQNMASINVKKGDKVNTKQAIGTVSKNPSNATYELHFEIWKNDKYLNPNQWLSGR